MSIAANLSDPRLQDRIAERYRQLRSRVDRARPTYDQYKRGELTSFNAEQKKIVDEFPHWLEDLEELRQGRMPAPRPSAAANGGSSGAAAAAGTVDLAAAAAIPGLAPLVSKGKKHGRKGGAPAPQPGNGHARPHHGEDDRGDEAEEEEAPTTAAHNGHGKKKKGGRPQAPSEESEEDFDGVHGDEEDEVDGEEITTEEDLVATLHAVRVRDVQEELIHAYVDRFMAHQSTAQKELAETEKKLSSAEGLKKKIISGAVRTPSKAQLSMIEQLPALRKQVTAARKKVKKEDQQLRQDLLAKLDDMSGASADEADEEGEELDDAADGASEKGDQPASEETKHPEAEKVKAALADDDMPPITPEEDNPWAAAPSAATHLATDAAAEEVPAEAPEKDSAAPPAEPEPEAVETPIAPDHGMAKPTGKPAPAPAPEPEEEAPEEPRDPTPPPPPPPPQINITFTPGSDWGKLTYSKTAADAYTLDHFVELAGPACKRDIEAAAAAAAERAARAPHDADEAAPEGPDAGTTVRSFALDNDARYVRLHLPIGACAPSEVAPQGSPSLEEEAAATGLPVSWLGRLQRELQELHRHPIPRLAVHKVPVPKSTTAGEDDSAAGERKWLGARPATEVQWHVDVAPTDGPLAGQQVHLTVTFPPSYPFVPPTVHCPVALPHKDFMVSQTGQANTLFITYREPHHARSHANPSKAAKQRATATSAAAAITTGGWLPDMGARVVLEALQGFFSAEKFAPTASALGPDAFAQEMAKARVALGLNRSRCTACTAHTVGSATCVNGPFLVAPAGAVEAAPESGDSNGSDEEEEEGGDDAAAASGAVAAEEAPKPPHRGRGGRGKKAKRAAYASPAVQGAIPGPFLGCWANLLLTTEGATGGDSTTPRIGRLHLVCSSTGSSGAASAPPNVEVYKAPGSLLTSPAATPNGKRGGGRASASNSLAAWAGTLLAGVAGGSRAADTSASPVWSLPASAWKPTTQSTATSTCTIAFTTEQEGTPAPQSNSPDTIVAALPTTAEPTAYAILVRVPGKEQALTATFTASALSPIDSQATETDASAESFSLWPGAEALLQGAPVSDSGIFVSVPFGLGGPSGAMDYLANLGAGGEDDPVATGARQEGYYIPRRVTFHLQEGRCPVVESEASFQHYRTLLTNGRRRRGGGRGGAADGDAGAATYLAMAPEEVLRRHILGENGNGKGATAAKGKLSVGGGTLTSTSAVAALSDFFLGLRTLFIPCAPCSTEALSHFKNAVMQLYRNPQASTRYRPPFNPLCALHLLSLVLGHAVEAAEDTEAPAQQQQLAAAVVHQILALAHQLAAADAAFQQLCASLAKVITEDTSNKEKLFLFQTSPFLPLYVFERAPQNGTHSVRAKALRDLGYAIGAASDTEVSAYEGELEVLARVVSASATGQAPPFDTVVTAASAAVGLPAKRIKTLAQTCNAAVASA